MQKIIVTILIGIMALSGCTTTTQETPEINQTNVANQTQVPNFISE